MNEYSVTAVIFGLMFVFMMAICIFTFIERRWAHNENMEAIKAGLVQKNDKGSVVWVKDEAVRLHSGE